MTKLQIFTVISKHILFFSEEADDIFSKFKVQSNYYFIGPNLQKATNKLSFQK